MTYFNISKDSYRVLSAKEVQELQQQNNRAKDWNSIFVAENFTPQNIHGCSFGGTVYLGSYPTGNIASNTIKLPIGLYNSHFTNCALSDNLAVHNVSYLSGYTVEENVLLFNIKELSFNKPFQEIWLDIRNENGGRTILAAPHMQVSDALLASSHRENALFCQQTTELSKNEYTKIKPIIGNNSFILHTDIIRSVVIEPYALVDGTSKLVNSYIHSSQKEPSIIESDVQIGYSIIGYANRIKSATQLNHVATNRNVTLSMAARVLHCFIGANSTISCCEVISSLVAPFHEQHHNNSFLIASTLLGQSNIGAGATIGSNHNSRAADGEIIAKRGFWPGLSTTFKHDSFFASFTLVAKGHYEKEINLPLPFSLVSKLANKSLSIYPAFWFPYNMYALERNAWKFKKRDKRLMKPLPISYDYLAEDTVDEMIQAIVLLQIGLKMNDLDLDKLTFEEYNAKMEPKSFLLEDVIPKEKVQIVKPVQALLWYKFMVRYYCAKTIITVLIKKGYLPNQPKGIVQNKWTNLAGKVLSLHDEENLVRAVKEKKVTSWSEIHKQLNNEEKTENKYGTALSFYNAVSTVPLDVTNPKQMNQLFDEALSMNKRIYHLVISSRKKDYDNPYRKRTYRNDEEQQAVLGKPEENPFLMEWETMHERFKKDVLKCKSLINKES